MVYKYVQKPSYNSTYYYLVIKFFNSDSFNFLNIYKFFRAKEFSRAILSPHAKMSTHNSDPSLGRIQNPCKINPLCKTVTREKCLRAKLSARANISPRAKVSSCKSEPSCNFVYVQFYLCAILCSRAN